MLMMMEHDRRRKKEDSVVLLHKAKENKISANLIKEDKIYYGIMLYNLFIIRGQVVSYYKILYTSDNKDNILSNMSRLILSSYSNRAKINYMLYSVNANPSMVSFDLLNSSNYPTVKVIINKKYSICRLIGAHSLRHELYDRMDYLKDYRWYKLKLANMSKQELGEHYKQLRGDTLLPRRVMIALLLKGKRREIRRSVI